MKIVGDFQERLLSAGYTTTTQLLIRSTQYIYYLFKMENASPFCLVIVSNKFLEICSYRH